MPRDSNGVYTLPASNPVVLDTPIEPAWANGTLNDIAEQLNNVITRDGLLGPTAPFVLVPGTVTAPGLVFVNDTDSGFYQPAPKVVAVSVAGVQRQRWEETGSTITGNLNVTGNITAGNVVPVLWVYPLSGTWLTAIGGDFPPYDSANLNNAVASAVTRMAIVPNKGLAWTSLRIGDLVVVTPKSDTSKMYIYKLTSSVNLNTTTYTFNVTYVGNPTADATPTGECYYSQIPQAST